LRVEREIDLSDEVIYRKSGWYRVSTQHGCVQSSGCGDIHFELLNLARVAREANTKIRLDAVESLDPPDAVRSLTLAPRRKRGLV
jgi:hypothetical protein